MSYPPDECTANRKDSDEPHLKLQKICEKMQENVNRVQKYVDLSKEVLSECCEKLKELRSQMADLKSVIEDTKANDTQQSFAESSNQFQSKDDENQRKKFKSNPDNEKIAEVHETNTEYMPGTSQATSSITNRNLLRFQQENTLNERETCEIKGTPFVEDVVKTALLNTEGVLSAQEFNSFLYLSAETDDPVTLAKSGFTDDVKGLYSQLLNFHFVLKIANDSAEKERDASNSKRDLEVHVQSLIDTFKAAMDNSDSQSQTRFGLFRQGAEATQQQLPRFNM